MAHCRWNWARFATALGWMVLVACGAWAQPVFRSSSLTPLSGSNADATGLGVVADVGSPSGGPDGLPDVVALSQSAGEALTVLFGRAGGGLETGPSMDLFGAIPSAVIAGDWDHDGLVDLAIGDGSSTVGFWFGAGDGTFARRGAVVPVEMLPRGFASADFNRDGVVDLVVVGEDLRQVGLGYLLYGDPGGSFTRADEAFEAGFGAAGVSVADFDGDGRLDIAVVSEATDEVWVLRGEPAGAFSEPRRLQTGLQPVAIAIVDVNRDGRPDIVTANSLGDSVGVFVNQGGGRFGPVQEFPVGTVTATPRGLAVGDVDGDGRLDLLVANNFSFDVSVLRGDGRGGFLSPRSFVADAEPLGVLTADWNQDGRGDAVVLTRGGATSPTAALLMSLGSGRLSGVENVPLTGTPSQVGLADLDGDGRPDLLVAQTGSSSQTGKVRAVFSRGELGFGGAKDWSTSGDAAAIVTGDFDGDLLPDFAVIHRAQGTIEVFRGRPGGRVEGKAPVTYEAGTANAAIAADFDADGRTDLVVAGQLSTGGGRLQVFLGRPGGVLVSRPEVVAVGDQPLALDIGDFNDDGRLDLVVGNNASSNLSILLGNGNGTFQTPTSRGIPGGPLSLAVADFDQDGRADVAVSTRNPPGVQVVFGDGTGRFPDELRQPLSLGGGDVPSSVVARDINGDRALDLLVAGETNNVVRVFLRSADSSRTFQSAGATGVNRRPVSVVAGDFDGDGRYDAAAATTSPAPTVSVLTNIVATAVVRGDTNGDGRMTVADFVAFTRAVPAGRAVRVEDAEARTIVAISRAADADGNGWISALDLTSLPGRLFQ